MEGHPNLGQLTSFLFNTVQFGLVSMALKTQPAPTAPTSKQSPTRLRWEQVQHSVGWMVVVAFLVRFLWIVLAHTYRSHVGNFGFGWEVGRLAYSLANGRGFSAPFGGDTGPSAWVAPVYPWIVSLTFRCASGTTRVAPPLPFSRINSLFAALTCLAHLPHCSTGVSTRK